MLFELGATRQERDGPRRRWFTSDACDLILWLNDDESLWGFQFCYDKPANEHALTWARDFGFSHMKVDTGGPSGAGNETPILVLDGSFDPAHILGAFEKEAAGVPETYRDFVAARVRELAQHKGTRTALVLATASSSEELDLVREMFREYQQSIGTDLCFQNFESELATLPGAYAPPRGRLYLGLSSGKSACCAGLRPCDDASAEMKRLYVRPEFRGLGYGSILAKTLIADAKSLGYRTLVLDTLPTMKAAQAMYEALGFQDIAPYTFNPIAGTRFMGLELQ